MINVNIDTKTKIGNIKPMHAVNNGPTKDNFEDFSLVKFPYARNHDASFHASYGSEHTVDISAIFPNFDNDPYKEESYDFEVTDEYIRITKETGCDIFYRLGQRIEHAIKKYNVHPPKDFKKWAIICEHIIKHYNEGWANGFNYGVKYWEIWNEPDNNPVCWTGTEDQFFEFFEIAAKHLKEKFPSVKVGGPAYAEWSVDNGTVEKFVKYMSKKNVPLDFLSWHTYSRNVDDYLRRAKIIRKALDDYGYKNTESILNEWNYLIGWGDLKGSFKKIHDIEGACLTAAVMSSAQYSSVDMLMYYDARPTAWNGLFAPYTMERLKGFYPFLWFSKLYEIGKQVAAASDDEAIYAVASSNNERTAIMVTYYTYDEQAREKNVKISLDDIKEYEITVLSREKNAEVVGSFEGKSFTMNLQPNSIIFIEGR